MPLFIQDDRVGSINSSAELFDKYPHLKVWLNLACLATLKLFCLVLCHEGMIESDNVTHITQDRPIICVILIFPIASKCFKGF